MRAFLDTNVVIKHLTGDPPEQARRATAFLAEADELVLADLVLAEIVYVLESFYELPRAKVAVLARAVLGFRPVVASDSDLLHRAVEIYELDRLDFAEAYLVACAERDGSAVVASFDRAIDRVKTVRRLEPGR